MKVELLYLGGQKYNKKDEGVKTFLEFACTREGKNMTGFQYLGGKVIDGDCLAKYEPLQIYSADVSFQKFGEDSRIVINSIE